MTHQAPSDAGPRSVAETVSRAVLWRAIGASIVGNILEWFDFAVYGYMASYVGPLFFPSADPVASNLNAFAVFAIGYFARPVGAVVLGRFGDRHGRRALLVLSIGILGLSSCAIGLLPTYARIGIWAPILLVALRLAQGFSVGGEYTGSMTYSTEIAPSGQRGFYSSFATFGTMIGILLSSGAVWGTRVAVGDEALAVWGWRIPFLLGLVVAIFGFWLRQEIPETMQQAELEKPAEPIGSVLARYWRDLAAIIGIVTGANVALYLVFVFAVGKGAAQVPAEALNTVALVVMLPFILIGGMWSDRVGRRPVSIVTNAAMIVLAVPVLSLCLSFNVAGHDLGLTKSTAFLIGQLVMSVLIGLVYGVQGAMVAELVPKNVRCMVFSVAYSLAMALFAGSSPMIAEWMLNVVRWSQGPAIYMVVWLAISVWAVIRARETYKDVL
ncbi:MAG: MFS transporter [Candidatus Riflebacteria bacterium]|nr:MFS transporter [Candidatus Riflebacteria bacterium]